MKDTDDWKETRALYMRKIKQRLVSDPEYAAIFRAYANERTRNSRAKIQDTDIIARRRAVKREERAAWRARLLDEPMAWEAHKFKARQWYHALSHEERKRIYYGPAKRKKSPGPTQG